MKRIVTFTMLVLASSLLLCGAALAEGNIYWGNGTNNDIMRVGSDGTGLTKLQDNAWAPQGVAVDKTNAHIYWTDAFNNQIWRCDLEDGANPTLIYSNATGSLRGLDVDPSAERIYYATFGGQTIDYVSYAGTGKATLVSTGASTMDVKVDSASGKVYWIEQVNAPVNVIDTDGSNESELVSEIPATMLGRYLALDEDGGVLYYTVLDQNALTYGIRSIPTSGGSYTQVITPAGTAESLDIDPSGGVIFYSNQFGGDILQVNTDGTGGTTTMSGTEAVNYLVYLGESGVTISDTGSVSEGDSGSTQTSFTISIPDAHDQQFTVDWATSDGTAIAGTDYVAASGTVTFTIGMTETNVSVDVLGDALDEFDETFTVVLSNSTGPSISAGTGTATIADDDALPSLSIGDATPVAEGDSLGNSAEFTVTLTPVSGRAVTVTFDTVDGTALAGSDYTAVSGGELVVAEGQTTGYITITLAGDTLDEYDETFTVDLSTPSYATLGDSSGTGTIQDDDAAPTVSISGFTATEGDSGSFTTPVTITLSEVSAKDVTCTVSTIDDSAIAGEDYTAVVSQTVVVSAGSVTDTLNVTVLGDTTDEANEYLNVQIDQADNATIGTQQALCTIADNDAAPTMSIADTSVFEGDDGTASAVFTVTLSEASGQTVVAQADTVTGTATVQDGDYVHLDGQSVIFVEGSTSETVTVTVNSDMTYEPNETFTVDLSHVMNAQSGDMSATGTILNDDGQPTVSVSDGSAMEGDSGTTPMVFSATLSNPSYQAISVDFETSDGTATAGSDYDSASNTFSFGVGITQTTASITVHGDVDVEGSETFTVTLSGPSNCTIDDGSGTGTIVDDDIPPTVSISDGSAEEGDSGTTPMVFTATLSHARPVTVTVNYATSDGTATAPSDYVAASGTYTFTPGTTVMTTSVSIQGDEDVEDDESLTLTLSNPVDCTIADGTGAGTILNDDADPAVRGPGTPWTTFFSPDGGGWTDFDTYPRIVGDVCGDGSDAIVGFGERATYVSRASAGEYGSPEEWIRLYGPSAGGWNNYATNPRTVGDVNGDGMDDIVAFGSRATYVSLSTGDAFLQPAAWTSYYGSQAGGWTSQDEFPRMVGDVNGDGMDDIVGFGSRATYVSLSTGSAFGSPTPWISLYGPEAGGWRSYNTHPRMLADVNGDGMDDIVAFGNTATYVSLSTGVAFGPPQTWTVGLGPAAGGWMTQDGHPRLVGDIDGDGKADIVAFGANATYAWRSTTETMGLLSWFYTSSRGWTSMNLYPRALGDANGDGKLDIIGFGSDGVYVQKSP